MSNNISIHHFIGPYKSGLSKIDFYQIERKAHQTSLHSNSLPIGRARSPNAPQGSAKEHRLRTNLQPCNSSYGLLEDLECYLDNRPRFAGERGLGRTGGIKRHLQEHAPDLFRHYAALMRIQPQYERSGRRGGSSAGCDYDGRREFPQGVSPGA